MKRANIKNQPILLDTGSDYIVFTKVVTRAGISWHDSTLKLMKAYTKQDKQCEYTRRYHCKNRADMELIYKSTNGKMYPLFICIHCLKKQTKIWLYRQLGNINRQLEAIFSM